MASVRALAPIKVGGRWLPPGSIVHGVEDVQRRAFGTRVEIVTDTGQDAQGTPVAASEPAPVPVSPPPPVTDPEPPEADDDEGSRIEQTAMGIDLLDPVDFEDDGRPKLGPLSAVLGFEPSNDELALALAMRADEGL